MNTRHLTVTTAALAAALTLSACGSNDIATGTTPASAPASSAAHGGGHGGATSTAPAAPAAPAGLANDADVSFLTGMKPHHQQAVEMSDLVLETNPPAAVAAVADKIKAAQSPEIQQIDQMLQALGEQARAEDGAEHSGDHAGMLSEADLDELKDAKRSEAALLYLEGMIAHHEGAIEAAEAELRDGTYEPARELATSIAEAQAAEITEMRRLLASL